MALLAASVLAILIGVGIVALLVARLWMKLVWRVVVIVLSLAAIGAVGVVAWLWLGHGG